jgi:hypothetical protein
MYAEQINITARGNAVGFTQSGQVVTGRKQNLSRSKGAWIIEVGEGARVLTNGMRQAFEKKSDAIRYAASLIDEAKTAELAWW